MFFINVSCKHFVFLLTVLYTVLHPDNYNVRQEGWVIQGKLIKTNTYVKHKTSGEICQLEANLGFMKVSS